MIGDQTDNSETRNNILCDIVDNPVIVTSEKSPVFSLVVIDSACHKIAKGPVKNFKPAQHCAHFATTAVVA